MILRKGIYVQNPPLSRDPFRQFWRASLPYRDLLLHGRVSSLSLVLIILFVLSTHHPRYNKGSTPNNNRGSLNILSSSRPTTTSVLVGTMSSRRIRDKVASYLDVLAGVSDGEDEDEGSELSCEEGL